MTKTIKLISSVAAVSAIAMAVAQAETQNFDIGGFSYVDSSAGISVEISVGGDYSIRAEGEQKALDQLKVERRNDVLYVGKKNRNRVWKRGPKATVYINMPALEGVEASSGSDLTANNVKAGDFIIDVSSGASAQVDGSCDNLSVDVSSGADADAESLVCNNVFADASSGADARVYASESVVADASSGADIVVYGNPKNTNVDKSSGGDVTIRN